MLQCKQKHLTTGVHFLGLTPALRTEQDELSNMNERFHLIFWLAATERITRECGVTVLLKGLSWEHFNTDKMVTNISELLPHCTCRKATPWETVQHRECKLWEHMRKKPCRMKKQELVRNPKYLYMCSPLSPVPKPVFPPQASWDLLWHCSMAALALRARTKVNLCKKWKKWGLHKMSPNRLLEQTSPSPGRQWTSLCLLIHQLFIAAQAASSLAQHSCCHLCSEAM